MSGPIELLRALARTLAVFGDPAAAASDRASALHAAACAARETSLELEDAGDYLVLNGERAGSLGIALDGVLDAMRGHAVRRIVVRRHAGARDIAQMIGLLVRTPGDADAAAPDRALDELRVWGVRLDTDAGPADDALPADVEAALGAMLSADARERGAAARRLSEALTDAARRAPGHRGRVVAAALARAVAQGGSGVREALREHASPLVVVALADAVVSTDDATRCHARAVFEAAGDVGAEALIRLLEEAGSIRQRRRCHDALMAIGTAVPALVAALASEHWYLVRNVAQLLGELRAAEACAALDVTLRHADARVRASVAAALEQIDTPEARASLRKAIGDEAVEVRRIAARAFGGAPDAAGTSTQLLAMIDTETDAETLLEVVRVLGPLGTPTAVQRLLRLVGGPGSNMRAPAVRLAALEALVHARGRSMLPTLLSLRHDRDATVRAAARRLELLVAA